MSEINIANISLTFINLIMTETNDGDLKSGLFCTIGKNGMTRGDRKMKAFCACDLIQKQPFITTFNYTTFR